MKISNKTILLLLIFAFSFVYRLVLMLWQGFPPGADIGLHNSVINSITLSGNTDFLYNYYQMGGGLSLTFPGYHIFTSSVILLTGMSDYIVHAVVVSFFSSAIVLCSFLITRTLWRESTAFIVAFLVAVSRLDIEMILWGGFPNIVTLLLIPLTFNLYLQRERFTTKPFLATTAILVGSIFLTHSLSAVVFVSITVGTIILMLIASKSKEMPKIPKIKLSSWLLPIILGAILVLPFLLEIIPAYLHNYGGSVNGGAAAIRLALLTTKMVPLDWFLPLLLCVPAFLLFSREYKGRFLTFVSLFLSAWLLIPTIATQGYIAGLYIDYNRFLYFIVLPLMMVFGLLIDHTSTFFSQKIPVYLAQAKIGENLKESERRVMLRLKPYLTQKNVYCAFVLGILLFALLAIPILVIPPKGIEVSSFYQVMNKQRYEALEWTKANTPSNAIFVSDAHYGWWLSGFAQRPTFSAVQPQYLTLTREFKPAETAVNLLDSDYIVDNGLIQIREDGGYIGRHNPSILAKLRNDYFPYPLLQFENNGITVRFSAAGNNSLLNLMEIPLESIELETFDDPTDPNYATITEKRSNEFFNLTQVTTVYRGVRFVNMSLAIDSTLDDVFIDWIDFAIPLKGEQVDLEGVTAIYDVGVRVYGQFIFNKDQPVENEFKTEYNLSNLWLSFNLNGKSQCNVEMFVGASQLAVEEVKLLDSILTENLDSYLDKIADYPIETFDYQKAIIENNISYIACTDPDVLPKFLNDPFFTSVFINDEVAIFKTKSIQSESSQSP